MTNTHLQSPEPQTAEPQRPLSWRDFAKAAPTLTRALAAKANVHGLADLKGLVKQKWNNGRTFDAELAEVITTRQLYDLNGKLRPVIYTIAIAVDPSARVDALFLDTLFPEYENERKSYVAANNAICKNFCAIIGRHFIAAGLDREGLPKRFGGKSSTNFVPDSVRNYLNKATKGPPSKKYKIVTAFTKILNGEPGLMQDGVLSENAMKLLKTMGVPKDEIAKLVPQRETTKTRPAKLAVKAAG